jgi:hypothetical protein
MKYKDTKNKKSYKRWKSDMLDVKKPPVGAERRASRPRRYREYPSSQPGGGGGGGLPPVGGEEN